MKKLLTLFYLTNIYLPPTLIINFNNLIGQYERNKNLKRHIYTFTLGKIYNDMF